MVPYYKGQDVFGYIDGITNKSSSTHEGTLNPAYLEWLKQHNLILNTIMAFLINSVLTQFINHNMSSDVWLALELNFFSQCRARTIQICTQLFNSCKGSVSAMEHFLNIKKPSDELAIADQPLNFEDIVTYTQAGLGHEYDSLVSTINA